MKVSLLAYSLSHNCVSRSYLLAELLAPNYDIEIVGPTDGEIWGPVQGTYEFHGVEMDSTIPGVARNIDDLLDAATGDVIYACKPRMTSYGVGLLKRRQTDRPLLLDIEDWESGLAFGPHPKFVRYALGLTNLTDLNSFYYTRLLEHLTGLADSVTVSNTFLQNRFGGQLIPHVRDTDQFDPDRFDEDALRDEFDLPRDELLVVFAGTPRQYKGVEDLISAVRLLNRDDIRAVIVGAPDSEYTDTLREMGGDDLILRGPQPFDEMPKWNAVADIVAAPQHLRPGTKGQMPAKVYDAMALAKPVVATAVSDIPEVLEDCGIVVDPESPDQLAEAFSELADNPSKRSRLGRRARQKCVEKYSYAAMIPVMDDVIQSVTSSVSPG